MPKRDHLDKKKVQKKGSVSKRRNKGAETISYAGGQCEVVRRYPENQNLCDIRLPHDPSLGCTIIHPFGSPGKTLYLDGEEYPLYKHEGRKVFIQKSDGTCWCIVIALGLHEANGVAPYGVPVAIIWGSLSDRKLSGRAVVEVLQKTTSPDSKIGPALVLFAGHIAVCRAQVSVSRALAIADFPPNEAFGTVKRRRHGSIIVVGDFQEIHFDGREVDLTLNDQVREIFRYMCERDKPAISPDTAVSKNDLENHLRSLNLINQHRSEWRPSQAFSKRIRELRKAIKCCNTQKGLYHIV